MFSHTSDSTRPTPRFDLPGPPAKPMPSTRPGATATAPKPTLGRQRPCLAMERPNTDARCGFGNSLWREVVVGWSERCEAVGTVTDVDFDAFVRDAEPRLRRALLGAVGTDRVEDAVGEALAYAFTRWTEVAMMENPVGYLYRVGQSKTRVPKQLRLFRREPESIPEVEPGLVAALAELPESQRTAVRLAHGCDWSHAEIAESMSVAPSTVATHIARGLARLRSELGVST